jgi:hypothetical protein
LMMQTRAARWGLNLQLIHRKKFVCSQGIEYHLGTRCLHD